MRGGRPVSESDETDDLAAKLNASAVLGPSAGLDLAVVWSPWSRIELP